MSDIVWWAALLLGAVALWGQVCLEAQGARRREVVLAVNDAICAAFLLYTLGVIAYEAIS